MAPVLLGHVYNYFLFWGFGFAASLAVGLGLARGTGFPTARAALAIAACGLVILGGSKLLYLAEARWFPSADYVPAEVRGALHGFRIPGGILALAVVTPWICRSLGLPWPAFGDTMAVLPAMALIFIRFGCFLNGCCFGKVSSLPWATRFPRGSWAFWFHRSRGWVGPDAITSLPVHPLQLYFVIAALVTFVSLLVYRQRPRAPGNALLLFYLLFFATTAVLEPFRENYLPLNAWLSSLAGFGIAALYIRNAVRFHPTPHSRPQTFAAPGPG